MYCSPSGTSAAARTSWPESPISPMAALRWGPERFTGEQALADEYRRLQALSEDYRSYMGRRGEIEA